MADNFTVINIGDYRKFQEGQSGRSIERGPGPVTSTFSMIDVHEPVELKLPPEVAAAGVEPRPESIHPKKLEGTEAVASPGTSHFVEPRRISDQELEERSHRFKLFFERLFMRKSHLQDSSLWGKVYRWAHHDRGTKREELELKTAA